jgi:hypothetical protein
MIALCIGAAPLHFGSKEPCILIKIVFFKSKNFFGKIFPYATTTAISGFIFFICSYSVSDSSDKGFLIGKLILFEYSCTGEKLIF